MKLPPRGSLILSIGFLFLFGCSNEHAGINDSESNSPVQQVYPYLDAANSRWFYFSSACRPFGMINLSPDTETGGAWGSGYRYNSDTIRGFSHIHAWQLSGLSLMPVSGKNTPGLSVRDIRKDYYSAFSHSKEEVQPGYHRVYLERYETMVELSSTTRVGMHKYTFPGAEGNRILVQLGGHLGPAEQKFGAIERVNDREFKGYLLCDKTIRRPKDVPIYFHLVLNTRVEGIDVWHKNETSVDADHVSGEETGAVINLADTSDPVLMKVGISYTSMENAKLNIDSELKHWDFEKLKTESEEDWNAWLGKIKVEGGTEADRSRFYTDLWKALQGRRIISDANGQYADMTGEQVRIRQIPLDDLGVPEFNHYNSDSFWGAQWTIGPLWSLVYPEVTSGFCNSFLNYYNDGGLIPRGPSGGSYTFVMTGASSTPFFVSAWQKGIRDFDIEKAYEGLRKNHMPGGLMSYSGYDHARSGSGGVDKYMELGYVPYPYMRTSRAFHRKGAGQTLEYAYQDWTLAQLAKELGKEEDYKYFMLRSRNYQNLYDPESGYMRPRNIHGKWFTPFLPEDYEKGFVESNSYQMTWFVMQDYPGLARLMGGTEKAIEKLNHQFEMAQENGFTSGKKHADERDQEGRKTPINYGNQPSMQTAFIFNELGAPWLSQKWSRAVIDSVYSGLSPHFGYNGDEDQGLMGSLAVLMKMGLFQLNGGTDKDPVYQVGSPVFDRIEIDLSDSYYSGKTFTIEARNNSKENIYIQSIHLNGKQLDRLYLRHSEIIGGGILVLEMGSEPNKQLGAGANPQAKTDISLFLKKDKHTYLSEIESESGNLFRKLGHHGPAVENPWLAFRMYFDKKTAIDVYSKALPGLELRETRWYPSKDEQRSGSGADYYKVGKTVGLGGVKLWDGEELVDLHPVSRRSASVVNTADSSYMEMLSEGISYKGKEVDILVRLTVYPDQREARVEAFSRNGDPVQFATGINYFEDSEVVKNDNYIATWGIHPEDVAAEKVKIAAAIKFNKNDFERQVDDGSQYLLISKPGTGIGCWISSANAREPVVNTFEKFLEFDN